MAEVGRPQPRRLHRVPRSCPAAGPLRSSQSRDCVPSESAVVRTCHGGVTGPQNLTAEKGDFHTTVTTKLQPWAGTRRPGPLPRESQRGLRLLLLDEPPASQLVNGAGSRGCQSAPSPGTGPGTTAGTSSSHLNATPFSCLSSFLVFEHKHRARSCRQIRQV